MATEAISKLSPHRTMYVRGFDRRGASAMLTQTSASGLTLSGNWSDQADFAVLVLHDADDLYGHLYTTKYLPSFSLENVVLEFDLAQTGCQPITSKKFQSIPWGALSWIKSDGTSGTTPLPIASVSGMTPASCTYTVNSPGTAAAFDRFQLIYLGNLVVVDLITAGGETTSYLANEAAVSINAINWPALNPTTALIATAAGSTFTVYAASHGIVDTSGTAVTLVSGQNFIGCRAGDPMAIGGVLYTIATVNSPTSITLTGSAGTENDVKYAAPNGGADGNSIELYELHKNSNLFITPANGSKLTGGTPETSAHIEIDWTALGLDDLRQAWLTFAPALQYDSGSNDTTLVAYSPSDFEVVCSNWSPTDPSGNLPLQVAGPGSVVVDSQSEWAKYTGSGWSQASGFYHHGLAKVSPTANDSVTLFYSCQHTHDLYVGCGLFTDRGIFEVTLDGSPQPDLDMYLNVGAPLQTRRVIAPAVPAGRHSVVLKVKGSANPISSGTNCVFDYLQAAVSSDVQDPANTYPNIGAALDLDTDQTYKISPQRALWILRRAGFEADVNFYAGVFFALRRVRRGGHFHEATVTLSGTFSTGSAFGDGDAVFVDIGGTAFGAAAYPADTLTSLAQRLVNGINALFVGVHAAPTATPGEFTIRTLSPINGFALSVSTNPGATGSVTVAGDISAGNEGTWGVDETQTSPLNRGAADYLADYCDEIANLGMTTTIAWSQELLMPPDEDTSTGAWTQLYPSRRGVLTSTGFGSWGAGYVEGVSGSSPINIQQTAHGYISGNLVHIADGVTSAVWRIDVVDADNYELTELLSGSHTPHVGDSVFIELQTSHCAFNLLTVTPYLSNVFIQTANIMAAAGLTPWLQFGEFFHWFFSETMSRPVMAFANAGGLVRVTVGAAHGFSTGERVIMAGTGLAIDGLRTITVVDATKFTIDGSTWPGGAPGAQGTVTGGGMALYDANQEAKALTALGRPLAEFWTQQDDPAVNGGADAAFLQDCLKDHVDAIIAAVLAAQPGAKFEILWAYDVCYPQVYYTDARPYPQGGRLNREINLPPAWHAKAGSGLDRFKIEALSWGSFYRNLDLAKESIDFPSGVLSWNRGDIRALLPWFNAGCPWTNEYLHHLQYTSPEVSFWAFDHLVLLSWRTPPLPVPAVRTQMS